MIRLRAPYAILLIAAVLIGIYFFAGERLNLAEKKESLLSKFTSKTTQQNSTTVSYALEVVDKQQKKPLEGILIEIEGGKQFTDNAGKTQFTLLSNKSYMVHIKNGWSFTPIYEENRQTFFGNVPKLTLEVNRMGSFLPMNFISYEDVQYNERNGSIRIPNTLIKGSWLFSVGTDSYIAQPCLQVEGNSNLVQNVWLSKVSGNLAVPSSIGKGLKEFIGNKCVEIVQGLKVGDTTIFRADVDFNKGSTGSLTFSLRDSACGNCKGKDVTLVYG